MIDLPVADPWFVTDRVGDGITLVTEPHVHPLLRCNVWHVQVGAKNVNERLTVYRLAHLQRFS